MEGKRHVSCLVMVNSARSYTDRRRAARRTWAAQIPSSFAIYFVLAAAPPNGAPLDAKELELGDVVELSAPQDGYDTLLVKLVNFIAWAAEHISYDYFLHVDDDSYIRLDELALILPTLRCEKLYWGYMWNMPATVPPPASTVPSSAASSTARTRPLRDVTAKSYMPISQWPCDDYPPFASGCAFILSADLTCYIHTNRLVLRPFRLIDAGLGIWLSSLDGVQYVHCDRVRPYRPLPLYQPGTLVQHYMRPEEFAPYHAVRVDATGALLTPSFTEGPQRRHFVFLGCGQHLHTLLHFGAGLGDTLLAWPNAPC